MLSLRNVTAYYTDPTRPALVDVSLGVQAGEIVVLLGPNGAGKSTVLRSIIGRAHVASGCVELDSQPLAGIRPETASRRGLAYVPEGQRVWGNMTVEENVRMGAFTRLDKVAVREDLVVAFQVFPGLVPLRRRRARDLSGGERQMVAMARAMMSRPRFLLLDEPSLGLAPGAMDAVFRMIPRVTKERGVGCLLVEQNGRQALEVADHVCVLQLGRLALSAPVEEVSWERDVEPIYFGDGR